MPDPRELGIYCVQFIYAGKKATLNIGNIKPIGEMPEGSIICNVEEVSHLPASRWISSQESAATAMQLHRGMCFPLSRGLIVCTDALLHLMLVSLSRRLATAGRWRGRRATTASWWHTTRKRV